MINLIKYLLTILICLTSLSGCDYFSAKKPTQVWSLHTDDIITGASLSPNSRYAAIHTVNGQFLC